MKEIQFTRKLLNNKWFEINWIIHFEMNYSQKNIEQLFSLIGSFPNQQFVQTNHFDFIKTKDSAWPNQLINLRVANNEIDSVLDLMENDSEDGKIPDILMLNPSAKVDAITDKLRERGYKSGAWYAMTHTLEHLFIQPTIPDFRVIQVQEKEDFREWMLIVKDELMGNIPLNAEVFNRLLENKNCYFFLGFEKNEPVATSFLFVNENNAGIYLVSTKKSHRKKGFGYELTNQCLLKAGELECTLVEIQATELGRSVYRKLGFEEHGLIDVFRIKNTQCNEHC